MSLPTNLENFDLNKLKYLQNLYKAELSLYEFVKQSWPYIQGGKDYNDGWHIQTICEHLEAVANREIKNLIINIPPRFGKSSIVSIAFPAWVWLRAPHEQFLYCSYASSLAIDHSVKCRRLILSSWYQERWGNRYSLLDDQNTKGRFDNTKSGYRISTSVGSSITGQGGSFLIADDPNNTNEGGESDTRRVRAIEWWNQVWSTRLNDKKNDCRIVIQQRFHERDITGYIKAHDSDNEWVNLVLPFEFEISSKSITVVLPSTDGNKWEDPRTKEGDLLWPEKYDAKALKSLKNDLGSERAIAGQLQQRPTPATGNIIKKAWFQWWKDVTPPDIEYVVQSWDTAFSKGKTASYSACTTWGVFYDHHRIPNAILLSMWRDRLEYVELREMAKRLYFDYRDTGKHRDPRFKGRPVDLCLIEAKASGDPLIKDLILAGIRALPVKIGPGDDKVKRVSLVSELIENGRIWVPARPPAYDSLLPFADTFVECAAAFPSLESNDVVDTMSQALMKLKTSLFLYNSRDVRD